MQWFFCLEIKSFSAFFDAGVERAKPGECDLIAVSKVFLDSVEDFRQCILVVRLGSSVLLGKVLDKVLSVEGFCHRSMVYNSCGIVNNHIQE
jgi:hypothetical protein